MGNIVGIMQPYFMPYLGYWQHIAVTDTFVLYDDVNYIKKGWINRNRIIINGKEYLFTIPLSGASQNKKINELYIAENDWKEQFWKKLYFAYHKSLRWNELSDLLKAVVCFEDNHLVSYIKHSIEEVASYLGIETKLLVSSELKKDDTLKGQDKILDICRILDATTYINPKGGFDLYDEKFFSDNGVNLQFIFPELPKYNQSTTGYLPGLSIIDLLFNVDRGDLMKMLTQYKIIKPMIEKPQCKSIDCRN